MKIIEELYDMIDEELDDACKYIKCAIKKKEKYGSLAQTFYTLSTDEMKHSTMLHDEVVKLVNEYRNNGEEVPVEMQAVYDYLHDKKIEKANRIKVYMEQYKEM